MKTFERLFVLAFLASAPVFAAAAHENCPYCPPATWNRTGVWDDDFTYRFRDGWVFPLGTNHLEKVTVWSQGSLFAKHADLDPFATVGAPLLVIARRSHVSCGPTSSNSYLFAWENSFPNGDTNSPVTASVELFRNGDLVVTSNGVSLVTRRVIPFPHDGFGQDSDWVRANFTNAEEILSAGYANWVDRQVGVGLENGLYKFTASFPEDPPEATELVVGDYSVCVTNAGEYVFVVEKGKEYSFRTEPYDETVEYTMQDDMAPSAPVFMSTWFGDASGEWSIDGGGHWLDYPGCGYLGWFGWLPTLQGSPNVSHLGPDDFPITFEAILSDYCGNAAPSFHWSASDESIVFSSPNAQQTEVSCSSLPGWNSCMMTVRADLGAYSLWSHLSLSYGVNVSPQVAFSMSAPEVVFLNDDDRTSRWYRVSLDFGCEVETNATITLTHAGSTGIRFAEEPDGGRPLTWSEVLSRVAAMPRVPHVATSGG